MLTYLFEQQYQLTLTDDVAEQSGTERRVLRVTLKNANLSHLPVVFMTKDKLALYASYMYALGNRPDLFPRSQYPNASTLKAYTDYDIPQEYLKDRMFAAIIREATKYLGYPYIWGGSSPETSFDCSGFVSWVLTNSGVLDTGRISAQGLCNLCSPVSAKEAKPGDLVFFKGTYDTAEVSHVGIYVGDGMMLQCGNPIGYASIETSYWQSHFYTFGRLPIDRAS
jgi:hypothetical protein